MVLHLEMTGVMEENCQVAAGGGSRGGAAGEPGGGARGDVNQIYSYGKLKLFIWKIWSSIRISTLLVESIRRP